MKYIFACEECAITEERDIPMDKYDEEKKKQICPGCGKPMERVIEFEGAIGATGGYDTVTGTVGWQH